jgi:formylglycine-generating enzyme required for sulfatase activity
MVTGRKPYQADTPAAILIKQATDPLPRASKFAPGLPQSIENILLKALVKDPRERYSDMDALVKALEGVLEGKGAPRKEAAPSRKAIARRPEVAFPRIPRRTIITGGLIILGIALAAAIIPFIKLLPAEVLPSAAPNDTATPLPSSTPTITSTPETTNTPSASPTPTPGIGSTWVRPADGMEMVYVPEGEFTMGSNDGPANEQPVHQVYLDAYWIDHTEVTNAMYAKCVADGKCTNPGTSVRSSEYANHPVTGLKWEDAQSYCTWAEGRLPTEAEWEKAARGTDGRIYPWGNDTGSGKYYLIDGGSKPVGSYPSGASPYGAMDMIGGAFEWVMDWYSASYYADSPSTNPQGPVGGDYHVLRGGSWGNNGNNLRASSRRVGFVHTSMGDVFGFRCSRGTSP